MMRSSNCVSRIEPVNCWLKRIQIERDDRPGRFIGGEARDEPVADLARCTGDEHGRIAGHGGLQRG
jgi:hypothetical protein